MRLPSPGGLNTLVGLILLFLARSTGPCIICYDSCFHAEFTFLGWLTLFKFSIVIK
jgi:hypothetical protein